MQRSGNRCEGCGVYNHAVGYRDQEGRFHPTGGNIIYDLAGEGKDYPSLELLPYKKAKGMADWETMNDELGNKYLVIVLTVAHLDHTPENCADDNLVALCQKCHNNYDSGHRQETRRATIGDTQLNLFK